MARKSDNLFQRLTHLFRSGPIIKRRVKAYKQNNVSTAHEVFKKTLSHVYSTAMSAYGTYDRMARYSDYSEMEYCLAGDTLIAVPGGYERIDDLAKKHGNDEEFIVYSYDHNRRQIVPALAKQARQTRTDHAFKVTFDSGKEIVGTGNHRLMLRDGTYRRIDELTPGDAMMPFYRRDLFAESGNPRGYLWVYAMTDETRNGWITEHKLIAEWSQRKLEKNEVVHHRDFNPSNNNPSNLEIMDRGEHSRLHAKILNGRKWNPEQNSKWIAEFKQNHSAWMRENNPAERKDITFGRILEICEREGFNSAKVCKVLDTDINVIKRRLRANGFDNFETFARAYSSSWQNNGWDNSGTKNPRFDSTLSFQMICDAFESGMSSAALAAKLGTTQSKLTNRVKSAGYRSYTDFKENYQNHRVVSVEYYGVIPLYDLTVDGFKNFATDTVVSHNTPEISSALDIYSEEASSADDKGRTLHIYSENRQIKQILNDLFYDTLNVEFNLTPWVRDLVKYGDLFLFNDVSTEFGVQAVFPIPVNEIEREEGFDANDPLAVRFRWVTQGNQVLENWQITHMRLLGNDAFLPYGSSVLESARRIWRQLILIEDAMLVYRVVRSPERRVFYIDVGNVPPEDVPNYMEQARSVLRSNQVVDQKTGRVDLRYNPLPVWSETPIPLLDGRTITIRQLAEEYEAGKTNWVYSVQDDTHRIVPGRVDWCGKNYTADRLIKVWLDNDTWVMTAPEHPFVLRDGSSCRADQLAEGDSLMPLYRDLNDKGYERCYNPATQKYETTHALVAKDVDPKKWKAERRPVVHHKQPWLQESNKRNNQPDNLEIMDFWDHRKWHQEHIKDTLLRPENLERARQALIQYNKSPEKRRQTASDNRKYQKAQHVNAVYNGSDLHREHNVIRRQAQLKSWAQNAPKRKKAMRWVIPDEAYRFVYEQIEQEPKISREKITERIRSNRNVMSAIRAANEGNNRNVSKFHVAAVVGDLKRRGQVKGWHDLCQKVAEGQLGYRNHKVARIEWVDGPEDVYCMTVVGTQGEDDRHNFAAVALGSSDVSSGDSPAGISSVFLLNSVDEDYFIPIRGSETGTKIDTLAGGTNVTAIDDVEYIQKKLFSALKIPKAYLGYDESIGSKATLSQEDIRFSRTIHRVQRVVLSELNKLAIIHLFCHGYDGEDLLDFELQLSNPSTIAQQQKLELYRTRFDIAAAAPEGIVDRYWVRKNIMGLTDDEIERIEKGRQEDKMIDQEIEKIGIPDEGGGDDFGGGGGGFGGGGGGGGGGLDFDFGDEGGEDEDLGGDLSGDDVGGDTGGDVGGDEEAEEGEEEEDNLLNDLDESDDIVKMSLTDDDAPVKAQNLIDKTLRNRRRRKTHGAQALQQPDLSKMVNHQRHGDSLTDPYDKRKVTGDPFQEFADPMANFLSKSTRSQARMTTRLKSTLHSLDKRISKVQQPSLISESEEEVPHFDLELEDVTLLGDSTDG